MKELLTILTFSLPALALNSHPRIWVTNAMIAEWQQKACTTSSGPIPSCTPDPYWSTILTDANGYKNSSQLLPYWPVTSISNANPMVVTVSGAMPHWTVSNVCFGGATGSWTAINVTNTTYPSSCPAPTWIDATHFSVPVDSTSFGTSNGFITNLVYIFWGTGGSGYQVSGSNNYYTVVGDGVSGASTSQTSGQYRGSGWWTFVLEMYISWQVTGNTTYVTPVLSWIDYVITLGPQSVIQEIEPYNTGGGYSDRYVMPALACAFDWFYSQLSAGERTGIANTLNAFYNVEGGMFYPLNGCSNYPTCSATTNFSQGNFWSGHLLGVGMAGLATYGDNPLDSGGTNPLITAAANAYSNFVAVATTAPDGFWAGGTTVEGYNYGPGTDTRILQYLLAVKTASGIDNTQPFANSTTVSQLWNLKPNRWQATSEGYFPGSPPMVYPGDLLYFLAYLLNGTSPGAWAQFAYQNFASCTAYIVGGCGVTQGGVLLYNFFWNPEGTATDYRTGALPDYYLSQGDWHLFTRTDWTDTAVWSSFNGATNKYTDHENKVAGNIDVERGSDYLIVEAQSFCGTTGFTGTPCSGSAANDLTNTLDFCDGGAYTFCTTAAYYGGQATYAPYLRPQAIATPNYSFMSNQLTYAYDINSPNPPNRTLRYWFRSFAWFPDGTMVVQDLSLAKLPTYTQKIRWQLNPASGLVPSVTSGVVSQTVGSSIIYIDPVYPSSPSITVTQGSGTSGATDVYQVDVTNGVANTNQNMLTVLYPAASATSFPTTTGLSTIAANWQGVQVADASPKVFVEPYAVTDNGNNTYTKNAYGSVTFTTTHSGTGKYIVAGLSSGTYSVSGNCLTNCSSQPVGADGTLYFTGNAGAYSISEGPTSIGGSFLGNASIGNATVN